MQPINYLQQVGDPFAQALQGVKLGATMYDVQNVQAENQRKQIQAQQLAEQQARQQQLLAQEQNRFFSNANPTMRDAARYASILSPEQSKAFLPYMQGISKEQQQGALKKAGQHLSALQLNPEVAIKRFRDEAEAARNIGDEDDAQFFENLATTAADPAKGPSVAFKELVRTSSAIPGAKEMFETIDKGLGTARDEALAPVKMREQVAKAGEAESSAQKAAVAAKFAESNAALDLQKKGWDITKIQEDINIAKQNSRIAAMNAQIAREGNTIKREENQLKLREMIDKRDSAVREKVGEVESARADMDNFLNTADRIRNTPMNVVGSAAGPISSRMPTLSQETADFEALVETLGSQAFMAQIPKMKGTGALSEAEGSKLQASLQNLSLKQSPERLMENVKEAQRLILKARSNLGKKAGLPESTPDTPAVQTAPADIDALVEKYGG